MSRSIYNQPFVSNQLSSTLLAQQQTMERQFREVIQGLKDKHSKNLNNLEMMKTALEEEG